MRRRRSNAIGPTDLTSEFCLYHGYAHAPLDASPCAALPDSQAGPSVPRGLAIAPRLGRYFRYQTARPWWAAGLRNILQLLFTYGIRGGQVRALLLEQIDWARNQILFEPARGKASLLPLTTEVGESLLDYLQNSRYPSPYPQVFLTTHAPYQPLKALSSIVKRRIQAVGIDIPSKGAHVFRHAFATRMLQRGHSLKAIADVLGHRDLGTTVIYAKVNFNCLRQVPLNWPEEVPR